MLLKKGMKMTLQKIQGYSRITQYLTLKAIGLDVEVDGINKKGMSAKERKFSQLAKVLNSDMPQSQNFFH